MSNLANELLWIVTVPLVAAAAAAFVARRLRLRPQAAWAGGVGLGVVAGQLGLSSRAGFAAGLAALLRPHEARDWLPPAVLLAMSVTMLAVYAPRAWRRWIVALAALVTIGVPVRLLAGHVAQQWSAAEKLAHLTLLAAAIGLVWLLLATARDDEQPRVRAVLLVLVALGASFVIALSGSLEYGKLCGVAAAAVAGTAVCHWLCQWFPRHDGPALPEPAAPGSDLAGAAGVITFSLGSVVLLGHFYAGLTAANAALLALSLVAAGGRLPAVAAEGPPWRHALIRTALCLVPLALALITAVAAVISVP